MGIDINASYIKSCKKLFANYSNVDIREMNFYNLEANFSGTVFDVIIFGSSFMLMPD